MKKEPNHLTPISFVQSVLASSNVYEIEDLLGKTWVAHSSRMWFYEGADYEPSDAVKNLFILHRGELSVEKIVQIFEEGGEYLVEINWRGFSEDMNTVQSLKELYEDIPELVREYLSTKNTKLFRDARKQMFIWKKELEEKRALEILALGCLPGRTKSQIVSQIQATDKS